MGKFNFRVSVNLVLQNENKICLMRRFNTGWNDGMYALMGGHVNDGENPIDAVIREAQEELGITISKNDLTYLFTMSVNPDHIYLYFGCSKYQGSVKNNEPDQCDDVRFFNKDQLPINTIEADKYALKQILSGCQYDEFGYQS